MTVADYLDLFDEQENQAELLNCDEDGEDRREKYVPSSVSKTWNISFGELRKKALMEQQQSSYFI